MSSNPVKRKLSAILAADAVGYSRMMAADEEGTMKTLSAHRAVIDGIIEFHEGRIVGTAGDSVLAEFGSPVEAVRCAVEIQDALRTRNDSLPEDRRLQFRVGVNLGDVMVKGSDLLGDGVNVAARLEGIAEPGGICISASVYDLIRGKLDLGFLDIGEQSLKNIEHPIRVYRVARDGRVPPGRVRKVRHKGGRGPVLLLGLGVVAAAAAGYGYLVWLPQQRAAAQKAAGQAAAAAGLADNRAAAAAELRRYDGSWAAFVVCEADESFPERTFGFRASVTNAQFSHLHGQPGEPGFLALRGTPDAKGRLVLLGRGLTGKRSGHPGKTIRARFEGRIEADRHDGAGVWGRRQCTAKLSRAE
jgi:class 3 adenylate cyclase